MTSNDPTSFANTDVAVCKDMELDWKIDFDSHTIAGSVTLKFDVKVDQPSILSLDTRAITVSKVTSGGKDLKFSIRSAHAKFGSALDIQLPSNLKRKSDLCLVISYTTSPNASALQWLKPEQTAGKTQPYLFSQCQAIHARSIVPCQDTPSVKCPYRAKVTVKKPLVALMSAVGEDTAPAKGDMMTYAFRQKVAIPSYLIAIVVGKLESRYVGPRTNVWSEVELVDRAKEEFGETEAFIKAGEKLVGDYVWGRYDLLVLPPTFPFGGMENPCLTFVTPTLLAGDGSLANVIAHEIAHSWTGNLVTNNTWEHFWLNEGHTVFLERKIMKALTTEQERQFMAQNGLKDLQAAVDTFGCDSPYTCLVPDLTDTDPDDAFSSVPYEKGHTLLFHLEEILGGPAKFEPFLLAYIENFKGQSLTTQQWKEFLYGFFPDQKSTLDSVDWKTWFTCPGMPPVIPKYDDTYSKACTELANRWATSTDLGEFRPDDLSQFNTWQTIDFLGQLILKDPFTPAHMIAMDKVYKFSASSNSEIAFRWLTLGIRAKYEPSIEPALHMVTIQGRMKFTRPLYRSLGAWDVSRPRAIETFEKNKPFMHSTTAALVEKDLGLSKSEK